MCALSRTIFFFAFLPLIFSCSAGLVPLLSLRFFFLLPTSKPRPLASGCRCCCWEYSESENAHHGFSAYTDHNTMNTHSAGQRTSGSIFTPARTRTRTSGGRIDPRHPEPDPEPFSGLKSYRFYATIRATSTRVSTTAPQKLAILKNFPLLRSAAAALCPAAATSLLRTHIGGRIVHKLLLLLFCCCYKHRSFSSFISQRAADDGESVFVCLLTNTSANGFDGAAA